MRLLRGFGEQEHYTGGVLSIGNFDGVHRGHQQMLSSLVKRAQSTGVKAVVMTFEPHPIALLAPDRVPPRLTTLEHKAELLGQCGVDVMIAYPTDRDLLNLTPDEFFSQIVQQKINATGLVEGPNFCFGKDRTGDVDQLRSLCENAEITLSIVDAVTEGSAIVSSSVIRRAIESGRLAEAVEMLGHPYQVTGVVETGARRGRSLGFATANLTGIETMLPAIGVYAGRVVLEGVVHPAAVHLGPNPTFGENEQKLEVHILDFDGDLYGQSLSVGLLARVRDTMQFSDVSTLQSQLQEDIANVRHLCNHHY